GRESENARVKTDVAGATRAGGCMRMDTGRQAEKNVCVSRGKRQKTGVEPQGSLKYFSSEKGLEKHLPENQHFRHTPEALEAWTPKHQARISTASTIGPQH
ncbi:unnamed protein product, partial [Ectocarpus sp. 8 AP-2014]